MHVLIVGGAPLLVDALTGALTCEGEFSVTTSGWDEATEVASSQAFDVVVMSDGPEGTDELDAGELRGQLAAVLPVARYLLLATEGGTQARRRARTLGFHAVLGSDCQLADLPGVIRSSAVSHLEPRPGAATRAHRRPTFDHRLTPRELEVLEHLALGRDGDVIARELDIRHNTVRTHLHNIFTKLGVSSRLEAVTIAVREGIIGIGLGIEEDSVRMG